jgi:hypothetical protein
MLYVALSQRNSMANTQFHDKWRAEQKLCIAVFQHNSMATVFIMTAALVESQNCCLCFQFSDNNAFQH